jgi:deoxyribonuclease I
MSVLYGMKIDSSQEKTLREWSHTHPVENSEVERAEKIRQVQGNRNPFIDHPDGIDLIQDF